MVRVCACEGSVSGLCIDIVLLSVELLAPLLPPTQCPLSMYFPHRALLCLSDTLPSPLFKPNQIGKETIPRGGYGRTVCERVCVRVCLKRQVTLRRKLNLFSTSLIVGVSTQTGGGGVTPILTFLGVAHNVTITFLGVRLTDHKTRQNYRDRSWFCSGVRGGLSCSGVALWIALVMRWRDQWWKIVSSVCLIKDPLIQLLNHNRTRNTNF